MALASASFISGDKAVAPGSYCLFRRGPKTLLPTLHENELQRPKARQRSQLQRGPLQILARTLDPGPAPREAVALARKHAALAAGVDARDREEQREGHLLDARGHAVGVCNTLHIHLLFDTESIFAGKPRRTEDTTGTELGTDTV